MRSTPPFRIDPAVLDVLERLWEAGHAAVVVGGAVRDALLGAPSADWDVATDARPERLLALFPGSSYHNRFGTVGVDDVEVTTFRRDHRYADHRRPEAVTFTDELEVDLRRRDLTINAIAWGRGRAGDATSGLIDPTGGRADLEARIVRAVGDPDARFGEDALRLLRAVRLAARLDFTIEPDTLAAMRAHAADVAWVAPERIGLELRQMFGGPRPGAALRLLSTTGLGAQVLPEIADGERLRHAAAVVEALPTSPPDASLVRVLGAILHGLPATAAETVGRRIGLRAPDAARVGRLAAHVHPGQGDPPDGPSLRRFMRAHRDGLDDLLDLRAAHAAATGDRTEAADAASLREAVATERSAGTPLRIGDLAVDGDDLRRELGLDEGPRVGRLLDALLEAVTEDPTAADRQRLLALAHDLERTLDDRADPIDDGRVRSRT